LFPKTTCARGVSDGSQEKYTIKSSAEKYLPMRMATSFSYGKTHFASR
jgi:hypothetical protein